MDISSLTPFWWLYHLWSSLLFCILKTQQNIAELFTSIEYWLMQFRINTLQYFMFNTYISHHCKQNKNCTSSLLRREMIPLLYGCYLVDVFLHVRCNPTDWGTLPPLVAMALLHQSCDCWGVIKMYLKKDICKAWNIRSFLYFLLHQCPTLCIIPV